MAMQTTKLSSRGQVVIPRASLAAHRWKPATEFVVEESGDTVLLRPKQMRTKLKWEDLIGCLSYKGGPPKTIEKMGEAVAEEALRHK